MDLSIVIVEYKDMDILAKAIRSISEASLGIDLEVIIISNSCYSESEQASIRAKFKEIEFIFNQDNLGFARAVNQGTNRASGEFVMLLNPDSELMDKSVLNAIQFMRNREGVGIVGPKIIDRYGHIQDSCRNFITPGKAISRTARRLLGQSTGGILEEKDYSRSQTVDWVSGACMLVRRSAIDDVGLMDERYFMYVEDMDWCRRYWQHNWEVWYLPNWIVEHNATRESTHYLNPFNKLLWVHIESLCKYFFKWGMVTYKKSL